ncbi:hypothetical protein F5B21DRAFT_98176 [Xylaria acuta]|nr:hypothetical protein F5B21DRAFT_98176 [Xylaria acuta]
MPNTPSDKMHSLRETSLLNRPLGAAVFNNVRDNSLQEERLAHTWKFHLSQGHFDIYFVGYQLSEAPVALARSTISVKLSRTLLQLGASTDYEARAERNGAGRGSRVYEDAYRAWRLCGILHE